jgi:AbrB family looped-hinge helix DNA binding protein
MAKVTSKLQVTIPKVLADRHGIRPGDDIDWIDGGGVIHLVRRGGPTRQLPAAAGRL